MGSCDRRVHLLGGATSMPLLPSLPELHGPCCTGQWPLPYPALCPCALARPPAPFSPWRTAFLTSLHLAPASLAWFSHTPLQSQGFVPDTPLDPGDPTLWSPSDPARSGLVPQLLQNRGVGGCAS